MKTNIPYEDIICPTDLGKSVIINSLGVTSGIVIGGTVVPNIVWSLSIGIATLLSILLSNSPVVSNGMSGGMSILSLGISD